MGRALLTNSTGSSFGIRLQITTVIDVMHNQIQALASRRDLQMVKRAK